MGYVQLDCAARALIPEPELRADCSRCAALCCVALAFDRSDKFAIDKASGEICRHLGAGHRCRIHAERNRRGFSGCVSYDCLGAGQRVTQQVFNGKTWHDDPSLLIPMTEAFNAMRRVHDVLQLLVEAERLPLNDVERGQSRVLRQELNPPQGWTPEALKALHIADIEQRVHAHLKSLRRHVKR